MNSNEKQKYFELDFSFDQFDDLLYEAEEEGNPFAMYYLAEGYDMGIYPDNYDEGYICWLEAFMESEPVQVCVKYYEGFEPECENDLTVDDIIDTGVLFEHLEVLRHMIIDAGTKLGLFYRRSNKIDELKIARDALNAVGLVGRHANDVETDQGTIPTKELFLKVVSRIEELETEEQRVEKNDKQDEYIKGIRESLISEVGEHVWGKFEDETQVGVVTAEACYRAFFGVSEQFDYTSVITPAMKGLEYEIKKKLYFPYIEYLKQEFNNPYDFVRKIREEKYSTLDNEKAHREILKSRNMLIYKSKGKGKIKYCSEKYMERFTIGMLRFMIGVPKLNDHIEIDSSFIDFCEKTICQTMSTDDIKSWLERLIIQLEDSRDLRNKSAHGGEIQMQTDAEKALDDLIRIKKILKSIVEPDSSDTLS